MGGGLMQLVAYGAQDVYLTGNPQITFFKVVYRRHTNFSMETVEHTLNGNPDFGRKSYVLITRNGDLITNVYLKVTVNSVYSLGTTGKFAWVRRLGHALIDNIEVEIGGSRIDKHYGTWLDIWYELTHTSMLDRGYDRMIGDIPELTRLDSPVGDNNKVKDEYTMFIPLQFWFCRNYGLALPLIALQYHEVRLYFEFTPAERLFIKSDDYKPHTISMKDASVLVNYIYLDSEERRRFAQVGHEYLIEQLQFTGEETANSKNLKIKLGFNHPSKELIWAIRNGYFLPSTSTPYSFLGYTEKSDWAEALQMAANNLGKGMIGIWDEDQNAPLVPGLDLFPAPSDVADYAKIGMTDSDVSVTLASGNTLLISMNIIDSHAPPSANLPRYLNTTIAGYQFFLYTKIRNLMKIGSYDLINKINSMVIVVKYNSAPVIVGTPKLTDYFQSIDVIVTSHNLTIADISVPTEAWTDTRNVITGLTPCTDIFLFQYNNYGVYLDGTVNPVDEALIQLNGHDRFDIREGDYFNYVQPYQHHTHTPADGINVYSFAIHPEQHQPSGTANLSRIDNTQLNIFFKDIKLNGTITLDVGGYLNPDSKLYIYDFSYNVLRIMSGMGGLAYSN